MSERLLWLAVAWHAVVYIVLIALAAGWKPRTVTAMLVIVAPLLSAAIVALVAGAPGQAAILATLACVIAFASAFVDSDARPSRVSIVAGVALVVYALLYPRISTLPWYGAPYTTPIGLVPCPTLATTTAFYLLLGPRSRTSALALAAWTAGYALFGAYVLHTPADLGLLVASATATVAVFDRTEAWR